MNAIRITEVSVALRLSKLIEAEHKREPPGMYDVCVSYITSHPFTRRNFLLSWHALLYAEMK